ncbi:MAG: flavin reductase family protein [Alphaproteobacteria bacterium]|nr:flavin reductase family protein [Alphaproteobacteria bacterium]
MSIPASLFRQVLGSFATGIVVVTARDADGLPLGVTVNSFTSVSLHPPLVLFCLDNASTTLAAFKAAGHFAINILREDQQAVSAHFARKGRAGDPAGAFGAIAHHIGPHSGAALIENCLGHIECEREALLPGGDHTILLGRVLALSITEAAGTTSRPLLYFRGRYQKLGAEH